MSALLASIQNALAALDVHIQEYTSPSRYNNNNNNNDNTTPAAEEEQMMNDRRVLLREIDALEEMFRQLDLLHLSNDEQISTAEAMKQEQIRVATCMSQAVRNVREIRAFLDQRTKQQRRRL